MSVLLLPDLYIEFTLFDKEKNIIEHRPRRRSHSWVKNHYVWTFCNISTAQSLTANDTDMTDVDNTTIEGQNPQHTGSTPGASDAFPAGEDYHGIVVGSGNTAEAFADYALDAQISHGTGGGELEYLDQATGSYALSVDDRIITMQRSFDNNSGGPIDVNEIGIIVRLNLVYPSGSYYCLLARDVLSATIAVANGNTLQVDYTVTVTYP